MGCTRQRQMSAFKRGVRPLGVRHSAFVAYLSRWRGSRACRGWFRRVAPGGVGLTARAGGSPCGDCLCGPVGWKPWTLGAGVSKAVTVAVGTVRSTIGRHNEVAEGTVQAFYKQYEDVLGK